MIVERLPGSAPIGQRRPIGLEAGEADDRGRRCGGAERPTSKLGR